MSSSFSCSSQHVLLILLEWFVRWEISGRTAAEVYPIDDN